MLVLFIIISLYGELRSLGITLHGNVLGLTFLLRVNGRDGDPSKPQLGLDAEEAFAPLIRYCSAGGSHRLPRCPG